MNQVAVKETALPVVEYKGQRVVTLSMVDRVHERPDGTARRNFNTNKEKLIEGEDYFVRNSSEAKEMGFIAPNGLVLLSESGYLMLVKSFTDDLSWQVQRKLVREYFRPRQFQESMTQGQLFMKERVDCQILILERTATRLRLSDSGFLNGMHSICHENGLPSTFLPAYTNEGRTDSLTELLNSRKAGISAKSANLYLIEMGLVEVLTRKGRAGAIREFKSLTEKGLEFGKNDPCIKNPNETQMRFYVSKFDGLFDLLQQHIARKGEAA